MNQEILIENREYARTYESNKLSISSPLKWIKQGCYDFISMPIISLFFGLCFAISGYAIIWTMEQQSVQLSSHLVIIPSLIIFALIAPFLALGLYQASWDKSKNNKASLFHSITAIKRNNVSQWSFAIILSVFMILWLRIASLLHVFYPIVDNAPFKDFIPFLMIGTITGLILSAIVFSISAFSIPLMLERRVDVMTAIFSSFNAVKNNILPMVIWAFLIGLSLLIGFATKGIGLLFLMPIIGYATWHSYKETISLEHK